MAENRRGARGEPHARRALALFAAVSLALAGCPRPRAAGAAPEVPEPVVRYVGRFDLSDAEHPRFSWPASAVETRFVGRGLHVLLKDTGYDELEVVLDGVPVGVVSTNPGREDYEIAAGLPDGTHDLALVKRTEARMGEIQLLGFGPTARLTAPARRSGRRIELVGDSITAGYGAEGVGPSCTGNLVAAENEYLSYGALAAREVGAEHVTLAWAGRTTDEMATLYDRTLPGRPASRWDFQRWTPDAVVINLGTNDFNHGDPGQSAFTRGYTAIVKRVRAYYPRAAIVCALGPMLSDNYPQGAHALTHARAYVTQVVAERRADGDTGVTFLEFPTQDFANGLGCDYHPSLKTHRLMAAQLAATLRSLLRW